MFKSSSVLVNLKHLLGCLIKMEMEWFPILKFKTCFKNMILIFH